jgi:hypothetical protein
VAKTKMTQQTAQNWYHGVAKINSSKPGQIAIAYADEQGNKHVGYMDLFDIKMEHHDQTLTIGEWFTTLEKQYADAQKRLLIALENESAIKVLYEQQIALTNVLQEKLNEVWDTVFPDLPFGL